MIFYWIHYLLVFGLSSLTAFRHRLRSIIMPTLLFILAFFAASRGPDVDFDYSAYVKYFTILMGDNVDYFKIDRLIFYEPSFYFIPLISRWLVGSGYVMMSFCIFALLGSWLKLKAFQLSNSFFLSVLLYVSNYYLLHEMTQIRAGVASGILLISLVHIRNRHLGRFFLTILAACFFHYSSIIFFPFYFLSGERIRPAFWLLGILISYVVAIFHFDILTLLHITSLSPKLQLYASAANDQVFKYTINIFNYGFIINIIISLLMIWKRKILTEQNPYFPILLKINIISICCFLLLSSLPVFAGRVSELFAIVQMILYPSLIYIFRQRFVGYIIVIFLSLLSFWNYFYHSKLLAPYTVWWA